MSDAADTTALTVRASDAERDRVAVFLKRQTAAGRLTLEELEQRIGAAYSARTHGQLRTLIADLPADADRALEPAAMTDSRSRSAGCGSYVPRPRSCFGCSLVALAAPHPA